MAARADHLPWTARVRNALPEGSTLPEDAWRRRHGALLTLLWIHVVGLIAFALARGYPLLHSLLEGSAVAAFAVLAMVFHGNRRAASAMVSLGLITSSAVLVHVWGGVIEAHFHFFVVLILLTLYEDWLPFILAALYVLVHHGVMGALDPSAVYNHQDAIDHPWRWAAIHAAFIVAAGAGAVIAWRLNEDVEQRAETRESEERFRGAFDNAPIGMALVSLEPAAFGRFIQVNRSICEMLGQRGRAARAVDSRTRSTLTTRRAPSRSLRDAPRPAGRGPLATAPTAPSVWSRALPGRHDAAGRAIHAIAQVAERHRAQARARASRVPGVPRRPHRAAATAECSGGPGGRLGARRRTTRAPRSSTSTASRPTTTPSAIRPGTRCWPARTRCGRGRDRGTPTAWAATSSASSDAWSTRRSRSRPRRRRRSRSTARASDLGLVRRRRAAARRRRPSRGAAEADQRMYASKGRSRTSAGRQATDALLKALSERNPDLGGHLDDVTDSRGGGRAARPAGRADRALLQAAALHDVGKVGDPRRDPGQARPARRRGVGVHAHATRSSASASSRRRRRSREAASSCARATSASTAAATRTASRATEIPLAARIIAVCDAYDAMTTDRPYRAALSAGAALAELAAYAGTQFDPAVVDAFVQGGRRVARGGTAAHVT